MNKDLYWFWLVNIKGIGRKKIDAIIKVFKTPENAFLASGDTIKKVFDQFSFFRKEDLTSFLLSRDINRIENQIRIIITSGIKLLSIDNKDYPKNLKSIYDPPYLLYLRGNLFDDSLVKIAIVGSRNCSPYGRSVAEYFAKTLTQNNIVIVSGMARGIDTAAHKGALLAEGKTIAVLGCGVNVCYPEENQKLMNEIISKGCVISETPINASPIAANFPIRNRIISGLCDGVLIVEAAPRSGSLITADAALEQGKDVFAIPGKIFDSLSKGTNNLIKAGAKPIQDVEDILEEYIDRLEKNKIIKKNYEKMIDKDEKMVYSCIDLEPIHLDTLSRKIPIRIDELQLILTKLEIKGAIKQLANKYFIRII